MTKANDPALVFWESTRLKGPDECWLWLGHKNDQGYGCVWIKGKQRKATHISLEIHGFPRPERLLALHSCDNPSCVNPGHLRWGTHNDNAQDKMSRGRHRCGDPKLLPTYKRKPEIVREALSSTESNRSLAKKLGVSAPVIRNIRLERGVVMAKGAPPLARERVYAALREWSGADDTVSMSQARMAGLLGMKQSNFSVALTALCRHGKVTKVKKTNQVWTLRLQCESS